MRLEALGDSTEATSVRVQLSLDYPNTWCPHLIRIAEIFGYQNEPRPSIIRVLLHAKLTNDVQSSYTNVLLLDIMQLQWTESYTVRAFSCFCLISNGKKLSTRMNIIKFGRIYYPIIEGSDNRGSTVIELRLRQFATSIRGYSISLSHKCKKRGRVWLQEELVVYWQAVEHYFSF